MVTQVYNRDVGQTCFQISDGAFTTAHNYVLQLEGHATVDIRPAAAFQEPSVTLVL